MAKASDFENNIFKNSKEQSIGVFEGGLRIRGDYNEYTKGKSSLDSIIFSMGGGTFNPVVKVFSNVKIKTEGDKYYITADEGISLTFTKVGERIIKDEEGIEYFTPIYPN